MKFMKLGSKPDSFQKDGNDVRLVATELATDIVINVGDVRFCLHKFPLLLKSSFLQKMVATSNDETCDEINIPDIPGGPAAFEICAKFCYGMTVTLNPYNVVAARCAAEYLEMHETMEKGNLIYKIEVFLNTSIFRSWKDSIIVLQSTNSFLPWSEDLKLVSHCIDSIASKASIDPSKVDWSYTYNRKKLPTENGLDPHWNGVVKQQLIPKDWWVEDLCELEMDLFKRVAMGITSKGKTSAEVMGEALKAYAQRRLPGFGKKTIICGDDLLKNQSLLENIILLLPAGRRSVQCSFLLKLLKAACFFDCGEMTKRELVRRIGRQLEEASVSDLMIPAPEGEITAFDVDMVLNILEEFIIQGGSGNPTSLQVNEDLQEIRSPVMVSSSSMVAVAKLVDGYLLEIAKDPNVPLSKFIDLAEMVTGDSRPVHDGLYRAIDTYLKEHPGLSKSEKKKVCGLMDCKKLSVDACMHAVQNERLPLRVVVQVLFFEQVRASAAAAAGGGAELPENTPSLLPRENGGSYGSSRSGATTNTEEYWEGIPSTDDLKSLKPLKHSRGSERSSASSDINKNGECKANGNRVKGIPKPKKMLSKLWSGKVQGGDNSSDTSDSPGSANPEEAKSTPPRNTRYSVS